MADLKIKGVADFSSITREVKNLSTTINNSFGESGFQIFDEQTVSFLRTEARNRLALMRGEVSRLKSEAAGFNDQIKEAVDDEKKQNELIRKRAENIRKISEYEQRILALKRSSGKLDQTRDTKSIEETFEKKRELRGFIGSQAIRPIQNLPVAGQAGQVVGGIAQGTQAARGLGLGKMGMAVLGTFAAAVGAATVAIQRMSAAADLYSQTVPTQLQLEAIGTSANMRGLSRAAEMGFTDVGANLETQMAISRAFGTAGSAAEEANRMGNVFTAARDLAIEPQEITQAGNQLRAAGGAQVAQKQMANILDKAITSGMDKSQATFYLNSATSLISQLNESGIMNTDRMVGLMSDLVANDNMSAEQAQKTIQSMNDAVARSQGEANVFFQLAAAQQNLGGGNLLGTQFAVRQGLTGMDVGALGQQVKGTRGERYLQDFKDMGLSDPNFSRKFAQGILNTLDERFGPGNSRESRMGRLEFIGAQFGANTPGEATKVIALLDKMASGKGELSEDERRVLEDLGKDPATKWRDEVKDQLRTIAGNTANLKGIGGVTKFQLGEAAQEKIFNPLERAAQAMDRAANAMLGGSSNQEQRDQQARQEIEQATGIKSTKDDRNAWERFAPNWLGGKDAPKMQITDPEKLKQKISPDKLAKMREIWEKGSKGMKSPVNETKSPGAAKPESDIKELIEETKKGNKIREEQVKLLKQKQIGKSGRQKTGR